MTIKDEIKMEIIDYIDTMESNYKGYVGSYSKEFKRIRDKYIYKEIGYYECKNDVDKINEIKRSLDFWKKFWESK